MVPRSVRRPRSEPALAVLIHRSTFPDVAIPRGVALGAYVFEPAGAWRDRPALIDGPTGRTLTYGALQALAERVSVALTARGVGHGQSVCLFSPNCPEFAAALFGVIGAGAIATTANPMYNAEELARQLRDAKARLLITAPALAAKAREAAELVGGMEVVVFGEAEGCTPWAAFVSVDGAPPAVTFDTATDIAILPYSSGTTGLPKGVMLTHDNLVANLAQSEPILGIQTGEHVLCVLPLFHIYGLVPILCMHLRAGATIVTMPQFDLEQFLTLTVKYQVRSLYVVPPIALALAKHPMVEQFDLSCVTNITSAAAPMGAELERAVAARLRSLAKQGYGMTETSPVTHFTPNDPARARAGSCGLLAPNTECRIVDTETRQDVGVGERGEIWIRGPQVMRGYLGNLEATAQCLDHDGWLRTGDVGYVDADGFYYIVDRLKEFIKYKGYQVAPAELEAILLTHPCIADAAVIPAADEEAGEIPKAFVVTKSACSVEEIIGFVARVVAPFKKVRAVEFIDKIPKSPSGKILRRELIALERSRPLS